MDKVRIGVENERDLLDEAQRLGVEMEAEAEHGFRRRPGRPAAPAQEERDAIARSVEMLDRSRGGRSQPRAGVDVRALRPEIAFVPVPDQLTRSLDLLFMGH